MWMKRIWQDGDVVMFGFLELDMNEMDKKKKDWKLFTIGRSLTQEKEFFS